MSTEMNKEELAELAKKQKINQIFLDYFQKIMKNGSDRFAEIKVLFDHIREELDLDMIFLLENPEYLYAFHYTCVSVRQGVSPTRHSETYLTKDDTKVLYHLAKGKISEAMRPSNVEDPDSVLHYGFCMENMYCGCVGFRSIEPRVWSILEKETLAMLGNTIADDVIARSHNSRDHSNAIFEASRGKNTVCVYHVDLITGRYHRFMLKDGYDGIVPEWGDYDGMLLSFRDFFNEDDKMAKRVFNRINLNALRSNLFQGDIVEEASYALGSQIRWTRMTFKLLQRAADGRGLQATMIIDDITDIVVEDRRGKVAVNILQENYFAVLSVDLENNRYVRIKSLYDEDNKLMKDTGLYTELARAVGNGTIHPEFRTDFWTFTDRDNLKVALSMNKSSLSANFKRELNGKYVWVRMQCVAQKGYGEEHYRVVFYVSNITEERAAHDRNESLIGSLSNMYFAVYGFDLENNTYTVIKAPDDLQHTELIYADNNLRKSLSRSVANLVLPEFKDAVYHFINMETISGRMGDKTSISIDYQRKGIGWCRTTLIPVEWDAKGQLLQVLCAMTDIDEEKRKEVALQDMRRQLQKERDIGRSLSYKAEHDPLTGALNRAGMERLLVALSNLPNPMAIAVVDVDHFKEVNDEYGHKMGDKVLIKVTRLLKNSFRNSDFVIRLGGDEFVLVLNNIEEYRKDVVVKKINKINELLQHPDDDVVAVSISVGIGFSPTGYYDGLFSVADEALYKVKRAGRAGCEVAGTGDVVEARTSEELPTEVANVELHGAFTGMWRLEFYENGSCKMYVDNIMKELMGVSDEITPEECFKYWFNGIDDDYKELVERTVDEIFHYGQAEVLYLWHHPVYGRMRVRCGGTYDPDFKFGRCIYGYHQDISSMHIVTKYDHTNAIAEAFGKVFYCLYFLDLAGNNYVAYKNLSDNQGGIGGGGKMDQAIATYIEQLVAPRSRAAMAAFMDASTIDKRTEGKRFVECDYLSNTLQCWCRAIFIPTERDEEGHVKSGVYGVFKIAEENMRMVEQAHMLKSLADRYESICHVNLNTKEFYSLGKDGLFDMSGHTDEVFAEVIDQYVEMNYRAAVRHFVDSKTVMANLRNVNMVNMDFKGKHKGWCNLECMVSRRNKQGEVQEVVFTIRVIQEEKTHERTLLHQMEYDSLTGFRNRAKFMEKANSFRDSKNKLGYLLFDIDSFADLIDKYGREVGDNIVVKVANALRRDGYGDAYAGRFALDQFAVIVNHIGKSNMKEIKERVARINYKLLHPDDGLPPVSVSVGVSFSEYGFKDRLYREADEALLQMKRYGGNGCRFFDANVTSNRHLSYNDWEHLKDTNSAVLRVIEGPLNECSFFALIDLDENTYEYLPTKELPFFGLATKGTYQQLIEFAEVNYSPNGDPDKHMSDVFDPQSLRDAFANGRERMVYEYKHKTEEKWLRLQFYRLDQSEHLAAHVSKLIVGWSYITDEKEQEQLIGNMPAALFSKTYRVVSTINAKTGTIMVHKYSDEYGGYHEKERYDYKDVVTKASERHIRPEDREMYDKYISLERVVEQLENKEHYVFTITFTDLNGVTSLMEHTFRYLDREKSLIVFTMDDITEKAEFDSITGTTNLDGFIRKAKKVFAAEKQTDFDILYFNIKEFKNINSLLGFDYGNIILQKLANQLTESTLKPLALARDSGDNFYCLVRKRKVNVYDLSNLCSMTEMKGNQSLLIRMHCGIYRVEPEEKDLRAMCDKAKAAASFVTNEFAQPYALYDPSKVDYQQKQTEVLGDITDALEKNQFEVYYQPVFNAKTKGIVSAEALIRWNSPERGLVPPGMFIPVLEEKGYVSIVDMLVYNNVKELLEQRSSQDQHIVPIAINLSRMDLMNEDMLYKLITLTEAVKVERSYLRFEITESAYIDISRTGRRFMERIQELGASLAVDDFGAGYSSFETLVDQQFDIIKLDMAVVKQIGLNEKAECIIKNVIHMAHEMGSKVIAEGVETEEHLAFLQECDCDYIQGFLLGKPMPQKEFVELLN